MLLIAPEWLHWLFLAAAVLAVVVWLAIDTGKKVLGSTLVGLASLALVGLFVASAPNARQLVSLTPAELGSMLGAIPLLPLIGAAVIGLFGRWIGNQRSGFIATAAVLGSFAASLAVLANLLAGNAGFHSTVYQWFNAGGLDVHLGLTADHLSGMMLMVITGIGTLIHWYSTSYMEHDPYAWRYFAYLNLFVAAMLLLVLGDNLATLFVGWEGVGLCSYLLIGFWFTDEAKASAGKKAFITNRIGDFGFLVGMFLLFSIFGTLKISDLKTQAAGIAQRSSDEHGQTVKGFETQVTTGLFHDSWQSSIDKLKDEATKLRTRAVIVERRTELERLPGAPAGRPRVTENAATLRAMASRLDKQAQQQQDAGAPTYHWLVGIALLCLFIGATGKSAQIPLYVWLPDAMAGPTPVSALIHAATMVTAGVYMIARLSFLFVHVPEVLAIVALVGVVTALFAALMAFGQNDIKKVLAYSTVSQLGYMFVGVGAGAFAAGTFHLFTHAFFKACLFLGSGAVIHGLSDEQDMRNMGGLKKWMPHTRWTFLIATITISGVLPFSGFWSKDEILHAAFESPVLHHVAPWLGTFVYAVGTLAALGTAFYMFRLYFMTFEGDYRGTTHPHEAPPAMTIPLWCLAIGSIAALLLAFPLGDSAWERFLSPALATFGGEAAAPVAVPAWPFVVALLVAWAGFGAAWLMYGRGLKAPVEDPLFTGAPAFAKLSANKFYVDELYQAAIIKPAWRLSKLLHKWVDAFAIDRVFVNGAAQVTDFVARLFSPFQNGDLSRYAALTALAVAGLLIWAVS